VDDDAVVRDLLAAFARADGHEVATAQGADVALAQLLRDGTTAFDCVVTDHEMPGLSGLELMALSHELDETLSVIIVTSSQSRTLVHATLRGGAVNFLDKPVLAGCFRSAVAEAMARTRSARASGARLAAVSDVGRMLQRVMQFDAVHASRLAMRQHPVNEVGGDFLTTQVLADGSLQVIFGDCSGHELSSAYLGAYFQGLARGLLAEGRPITEILARFNDTLVRASSTDWDAGGAGASLAVCGVRLTRGGTIVEVLNAGTPYPWHVDADGRIAAIGVGGTMPLGWFVEAEPVAAAQSIGAGSTIWMYTDGLEEIAEAHGVSPLALASTVLTGARGHVASLLAGQRDDVLVAQLNAGDELDEPGADVHHEPWYPVLRHEFAGDGAEGIQAPQDLVERCLVMVAPDLPEWRLADVLVSVREGLLNAMKHGCGGHASSRGVLHLAVRPRARVVRATIEDPGPGHDFRHDRDPEWDDDNVWDAHRGLAMIHAFASTVTAERRGAVLRLDFHYRLPGDLP
jgi:FixJ family two-component response regulator/anti-sigma regulatory factor (Ser/Thr protein kinase)